MKEALKQIVYLLKPVAALADGTPFENSEVIQRCVDATEIALKALAQPVQEPWCMKMNRCTTKCEDCPDEPAQEPVSVTYKEVADAMNSLWNGTLEQHQIAEQMANKKLYTTPQQRPWVGLTEAQFLEATRLAENGNYLVAFVRIQEWLKEQNT